MASIAQSPCYQILKEYWKNLCIRIHTFPNNNNAIYNMQFGFRQHNSTSHTLINITENMRKTLDAGNIGCGAFCRKAFDIETLWDP